MKDGWLLQLLIVSFFTSLVVLFFSSSLYFPYLMARSVYPRQPLDTVSATGGGITGESTLSLLPNAKGKTEFAFENKGEPTNVHAMQKNHTQPGTDGAKRR